MHGQTHTMGTHTVHSIQVQKEVITDGDSPRVDHKYPITDV